MSHRYRSRCSCQYGSENLGLDSSGLANVGLTLSEVEVHSLRMYSSLAHLDFFG